MIAEDQEDYNSTNNASNTAVYYFENPSIHPHYHVQAYQGRERVRENENHIVKYDIHDLDQMLKCDNTLV